MKRILLMFIMLVLVVSLFGVGETPDILSYLPRFGELRGWEPSDKAQHMVGEDLFLLINGGAEIYHEYGFKQVVAQGFKNGNGKAFNLEIYEMQDAAAAYGIYTFKTGETGKTLDVGDQGLVEDYYLNVRKGAFLVTVIGFDSEKETMDGIEAAAKLVVAKINGEKGTGNKTAVNQDSARPELVSMLPEKLDTPLKANGITYLKGNLALFNHYQFDTRNIFGISEGVIGDYEGFKLFIFQYVDEEAAGNWFENARKSLRSNTHFKDFKARGVGFSLVDEKGETLYLEGYKRWIFVVLGKKEDEVREVVRSLRAR